MFHLLELIASGPYALESIAPKNMMEYSQTVCCAGIHRQALSELPNMKGAMDRLTADQYHDLKIGQVGDEVEALDAVSSVNKQIESSD